MSATSASASRAAVGELHDIHPHDARRPDDPLHISSLTPTTRCGQAHGLGWVPEVALRSIWTRSRSCIILLSGESSSIACLGGSIRNNGKRDAIRSISVTGAPWSTGTRALAFGREASSPQHRA